MSFTIADSTNTQVVRSAEKVDNKFSSPLLNITSPNNIGGVSYTRIYSTINTNYKVGDKVFIMNGNLCSIDIIDNYIYSKHASGYKILQIDNCSITIDLEFNNVNVYDIADFNDEEKFIKFYVVNDELEAGYYNYQMNNYKDVNVNFKFEHLNTSGNICDVIYNNSGSTLTINGTNILPNTLYSYDNSQNIVNITLSSIKADMSTNDRCLYIMNSYIDNDGNISSENLEFERGLVYKYIGNDIFKIDRKYLQSYISKSIFKFGTFTKGTFNDGIFGYKIDNINDLKTVWNGATWENGIFYSSIWNSGLMKSKSDRIKQQSYYTTIENFQVKESTDFTNNNGYGYNFIVDSIINDIQVNNGNFTNVKFLDNDNPSVGNVKDEFYLGNTNTSILNIKKGRFNKCEFNYAILNRVSLNNCIVNNSTISKNSLLYDNSYNDSIIDDNILKSNGSVNIIDYDKFFYKVEDNDLQKVIITHRFYISDEDFLKFKYGDLISFNKLVTNHSGVDTIFDRKYKIGIGNEINTNGFNSGYLDSTYEVLIDLRPKIKDEYEFEISSENPFTITNVLKDKVYNSIDLNITVSFVNPSKTGSYNTGSANNTFEHVYNTIIKNEQDFSLSVTDIKNANIQTGFMNKTVFTNSTWENSFYETKQDLRIDTILNSPSIDIIGSYNDYQLKVDLEYSDNRDLWFDSNIEIGDIVYLNNIIYEEGTYSYDLSSEYSVATYSFGTASRDVTLEDYNTNALNIGTTFSLTGDYSYRNTLFKRGYLMDSKIENSSLIGGSFKNIQFNDCLFSNPNIDTLDRTLDISNINYLKIYNTIISQEDNNVIDGAFFNKSLFENVVVKNGIVSDTVQSNTEWNGGLVFRSWWTGGTFNNGIMNSQLTIEDSVNFTQQPIDISGSWHNLANASWISGTFNNGNIESTYWFNGTFNNGEFYKSIWNNGIWNNGTFGKENLNNISSQFREGTWSNGTFIKGTFGWDSFSPSKTVTWEGGSFNGGIFIGAMDSGDDPLGNSIWNGGTFNNGEFRGSAIWNDGIFNNGKFKSVFGTGMGTQSSNYSWREGQFNGGEFGDINAESNSTWNSTWYDGKFTGGIFKGKVWNDGIFTGGKFLGMTANGASSSNYFYDEPMNAVQKPEHFVLSYSTDVSNKNWHGLWRNGTVTSNEGRYLAVSSTKTEDIKRVQNEPIPTIEFRNTLWVDGIFDSSSGVIENTVWLNGTFNRGTFDKSNFNPFVPRWDFYQDGGGTFNSGSSNVGVYTFQFSDESCIWKNGVLKNSNFEISKWMAGSFEFGTMSNAEFNSGVSKYMNAYNVIWNGGRWRNGNWYGADIDVVDNMNLNFSSGADDGWNGKFTTNITGVVHQMIRNNSIDIFMWNVFTTDSEYAINSPQPQIPNNNTYQDASGGFINDLLGGNLVTSPGFAEEVDFDDYKSLAYNDAQLIILSSLGGDPYGLSASATVDGSEVRTKFGNGAFKNGIWENGVWNNGAREDYWENTEKTHIFDTVSFYNLRNDVWQIILKGSSISNIADFQRGDDITIGNIVAKDINGNRKFFKRTFKIIDVNVNDNLLYVNVTVDFPIRSIERDSLKHKIKVSKNVWLSGVFLNGRFEGIWNDGYVKGYPKITEIIRTSWIDGIFDGGRFLADTATYSDSITGTTSYATYSTGLVQNFTLKTNLEKDSTVVLNSTDNRFHSWMDINYNTEMYNGYGSDRYEFSSISFGPPATVGNLNPPHSPYYAGENISEDVLSSETNFLFRPFTYRNINMGVKLSEYDNVITDEISGFTDIQKPDRLENYGWEFYTYNGSIGEFEPLSATQSIFTAYNTNNGSALNEMVIQSDIFELYLTKHEKQSELNKFRYSKVSFDILYSDGPSGATSGGRISPFPYTGLSEASYYINDAYLNNYTTTVNRYFYNRNELMPLLLNFSEADYEIKIDNLRLTEIDMVPFIDYAKTKDNGTDFINFDIQIPFQATAPFIPLDDSDFIFINSVSFEFDSNLIEEDNNVPIVGTANLNTNGGGGNTF